MNVLFMNNGTGSRIWRLDPYADYLERTGHHSLLHPHGENFNTIEAEWADVAIVQMILERRIIEDLHAHHCAVIYEIDDLVEKVTKKHPSYHRLSRWSTMYRTHNCIRKSDALFVSTNDLYRRYGYLKRRKDKYIFPNLLNLPFWEKPYRHNESPEIRLGWAGSWAHKDDLEFIAPILKIILRKYQNVKFVYCGMGGIYTKTSFDRYVWGEDIFKDIPPERREYHESVEPEVWPEKLANLRLDIGIAPVMNNAFSRAKSNIKWQEYSINKIPGVYSDVLYGDTVRDGVDGFVAGNVPITWIDRISRLIENEEERKHIRENAYERARTEFSIERQYQPWLAAVTDVHSRYVARKGGKSAVPSIEGT